MQDYRTDQEKKQAEKQTKQAMIILLIVLGVLLFVAVDIIFSINILLFSKKDENGFTLVEKIENWIEQRAQENEENEAEESSNSYLKQMGKRTAMLAGLGDGYEGVWIQWKDSTNCVAQKDGKWGMITLKGEEIVPFVYERYNCSDKTGWVEFEKDGKYFVYNKEGKLVKTYEDKLTFCKTNEDGSLFRTACAYMSGMKITTYLPENVEDDFYGIRYENYETGEVLYEAIGNYYDAESFSFPDEDGRAVVIQGDGKNNTLHLISENGCESRTMELPENVYCRYFDFPGDYQWADNNFSKGWLRVYVYDEVAEFLMYEEDIYMASLNVDTLELIRFPEKYQNFYMMYDEGYGELMAFTGNQEEPDIYLYAICKGDQVLTEEKYYRIVWDENYIIGVTETQTEILDHDGNVLAEYPATGEQFVDDRMLVYDGKDVYYIDRNLEPIGEICLKDVEVDDCFAAGIVIDNVWYLLGEAVAYEAQAVEVPAGAGPLKKSGLPEGMKIRTIQDAYWTDHMNQSLFAAQKGEGFTVWNYAGDEVIQTEHAYYYHYDEEWIGLITSDNLCHVYDTEGRLLYEHPYVEQGLYSAEGIPYRTYIQYQKGMRIELDIGEEDTEYYGVHYYNADTGELIFEAVGGYENIAVSSLPDEYGMAVVVTCCAGEYSLYKITENGYTKETYTVPGVEVRDFYYSDYIHWLHCTMSEGWMKVMISDRRGDLLDYSTEWQEVLYNIDTQEIVPLPNRYQGYSKYYTISSKGLYYGITGLTEEEFYGEEETGELYYAICYGSGILTEEIYTWIHFDRNYILAGNDDFAHILDYEGNIKAQYADVGTGFRNGKLLVFDGKGLFFIDEDSLTACTGYVRKIDDIYCEQRSFWSDDGAYMIIWEGENQ